MSEGKEREGTRPGRDLGGRELTDKRREETD